MKIDYKTCEQLLDKIIKEMQEVTYKPDVVIALSRGGLIPGVRLSHEFNTLFFAFNKIDNVLPNIPKHYEVLIVDDINDTGETLEQIAQDLESKYKNISFCALVNNITSSFEIDFYGKLIDRNINKDWVDFYWEQKFKG